MELGVAFVAMDQYEWGDQAGHTNGEQHEAAVLAEAGVEGAGVVDEVAVVVAQFEIGVVDEYYY